MISGKWETILDEMSGKGEKMVRKKYGKLKKIYETYEKHFELIRGQYEKWIWDIERNRRNNWGKFTRKSGEKYEENFFRESTVIIKMEKVCEKCERIKKKFQKNLKNILYNLKKISGKFENVCKNIEEQFYKILKYSWEILTFRNVDEWKGIHFCS